MKKTTTQDGVFIHKSISCSNGVTPYEKSMEMKKILQETADQNTSAYILKKLKLYALARLEISDKKQDADDRQRQDCKKILEKTELLTAIIERPETSQDFLYTQFYDLGVLAQRADIRPIEPLFEMGKLSVDGGKTGGEKSGEIRRKKTKPLKELWQAKAEKIWGKHPTWNKSDTAREIVKSIGGNLGTIRKSIQNPLL